MLQSSTCRQTFAWIIYQHFLLRQTNGINVLKSYTTWLAFNRLQPRSPILGHNSLSGLAVHLGKVGLKSGNWVTPGHTVSLGVPRVLYSQCKGCHDFLYCTYLNILNSWSISESPWKRGLLVTISAKMQAALHTSTGQEYRCEPRSTSGALYHNVTTWIQRATEWPHILIIIRTDFMSVGSNWNTKGSA